MCSALTFTGGAEFFFLEKNHDFSDTTEGTVLHYDFTFTNKGDKPLVISGFKVACTCTKITFPNVPILPNEKGIVHLSFDTAGKFGYQNRKIELISNATNSVKLSFRVFVIAAN